MSEKQLINAAVEGNLGKVKRLLQPSVDVNAKDSDGWTSLHNACWKGHVEVALLLADHPQAQINLGNPAGETAFMAAIDGGNVALVRHFLSKPQLELNRQDNDQWTALHHACFKGHVQVVELLLQQAQIDLSITDQDGKTALDLAGKNKAIQAVFAEHTDDIPSASSLGGLEPEDAALLQAAYEGDHARVESLVGTSNNNNNNNNSSSSKSVNVNVATPSKETTALHLACKQGHASIVQLLVNDTRTWINLRDKKGWTALHWACHKRHEECVALLLDHRDVDVHARNQQGESPVDFCHQNAEMRNLVLDTGSPVDPLCEQWWSAARAGRTAELQFLVQSGSVTNLNAATVHNGMTALHLATRHGHIRTVQYLVSQQQQQPNADDENNTGGIDLGATDAKGRTALHEACRWKENIPLIQYLLSQMTGDVVNAQNAEGHTALHVALSRNNTQAVTSFLEHENVDPHLSLLWIVQNFGVQFLEVFASSFTKDRAMLRKSIRNAYTSVEASAVAERKGEAGDDGMMMS